MSVLAALVSLTGLVRAQAAHDEATCRPSGPADLRVAKALGAHGYDAVRVTAITHGLPMVDAALTYSMPFKYRWTHLAVSTGLVTGLQPGVNKLQIGDSTACVRLPPLGAGVRGLIFGDPCTGAFGGPCLKQSSGAWQLEDRLTRLLNLAAAGPEPLDFWAPLGDNFYDKTGNATQSFFGKLGPEAKSSLLTTVVGNGDLWTGTGTPDKVTCDMPFGYGFLQWYGQDTMAGKDDPRLPFDFSISPPSVDADLCQNGSMVQDRGWTAAGRNFFSYHILGNVGFIGFSGHTSFEEQASSIEEACTYFQEHADALREVLIFGHWSGQDHGCPAGGSADTGHMQRTIRQRFALTPCAHAKAFYGHVHCNVKDGWDCGPLAGTACFQLGATGMPDPKCKPHWGVLYFDTTNGTQLTYFELGNESSDLSQPLLKCLQERSLSECSVHGTTWLSEREETQREVDIVV